MALSREASGLDRPSAEPRLVKVLLDSAEKVVGVLAQEPVDAAERSHAEVVLALSLAPIWGRMQLLTLSVQDDGVTWQGERLLDAGNDRSLLVEALRTAGIRSLTLLPGVERGEMQLFLAAVDRARRGGGRTGADLVTLLFRADLRHLRYELVAETGPVGLSASDADGGPAAPVPLPAPAASLREAVRDDAREERPRGVVRPEEFDSTLYFLDQREIEYLKAAVDEEYARSPARRVIALLFETLEARAEPAVRAEVLEVLGGLLPTLLGSGQFEDVTELVSEARRVSQAASAALDERQKGALDRLRFSVSEPAVLSQLFHALEYGEVRTSPGAIWILMRELSPDAIRHIMLWPEQMSNREVGAMVSQAIDAFFEEWPLALGRLLVASERAIVHAALEVAARGRHPEFADLVAQLARDPDPSTRTRVARTLSTIGTLRAFKFLSRMASDSDTDVRALVFAAFSTRPYRSALPMLESAMAAPDLEQRGERERRALFEAYAACAEQEGSAALEAILRGRVPSGRRASSHTRACAALALGRIGTPRARAALCQASGDRDPVVRNAVSSALKDIP